MKKSIIRPSLKILIVLIMLIAFNLLASANNQAPEKSEKEVVEQNYNISIECSLNYDINLDNSARATIYLQVRNDDKNKFLLGDIYLTVAEVPANITNIKVIYGKKRTHFSECHYNCSSCDDCIQHIGPQEYCHFVENKSPTVTYRRFCVGINSSLGSHNVANLYISYLIDDIVERSEDNIKCLHIPPESFDNFWVVPKKYKEEDSKLKILAKKPIRLRTKSYNILINFPQDRYRYSRLVTVPLPYPDVISMHGNTPMLSWHFTQNNRNTTPLLIPSYEIQKDKYMFALDVFGLIALTLGFISILLAIGYKKRILCIVVVIYAIIIFAYFSIIFA